LRSYGVASDLTTRRSDTLFDMGQPSNHFLYVHLYLNGMAGEHVPEGRGALRPEPRRLRSLNSAGRRSWNRRV